MSGQGFPSGPLRTSASSTSTTGSLKAEVVAGNSKLVVRSEIAEGEGPSPLDLIAAGLASCEALMAVMVAEKLGVKAEVSVDAELDFEISRGLINGKIIYKFRGVARETAERIVDLVKKNCPVYATLSKSADIKDEVIIE